MTQLYNKPKKRKYWSLKYKLNACVKCHLSKFPHQSHGVCSRCNDLTPKRHLQLLQGRRRYWKTPKGKLARMRYYSKFLAKNIQEVKNE